MDLWIRSQDREILTPIQHSLNIEEYIKYKTITERQIKENKRNEFTEMFVDKEVIDEYIRCEIIYMNWSLGSYSTKERALKVLDEIQSFIENNYISIDDIPSHSSLPHLGYYQTCFTTMARKKVFQMPKE